ncbi:MAG: hypothetical protein LBV20_05005 [Treponema sp.]|jgi:hypothetical protein|nr:hypothetical protein [Treponema sp.]
MMKRAMLKIVIGIFCLSILTGCVMENNYPYIILAENKTTQDITLLSFPDDEFKDYNVLNETPIVIQAGKKVELFSYQTMSDMNIVFLYNEKKYLSGTGYTEHSTKFTIQFWENENNELSVVNKTIRYGTQTVYLEEIL